MATDGKGILDPGREKRGTSHCLRVCRSFLSLLLRTLLVGVIKPESPATAAAILAAKDPAKTWHDYEASGGKIKLEIPTAVPPEQMKVLNINQKLMDDLGANVTPAIYYMSKDNTLQQEVGLPDKDKLNIIMGNK